MDKNFTEQDIRAIIRDEIAKAFGYGNKDIEFLPTSKAYKKLGYPSAKQLRKAIDDGILRIGHEVQDRRSDDSTKPIYYFNIQACIKQLNKPPEKRVS